MANLAIDGKVVQENKIDGDMSHNFNIPMRIVTGIEDEDDGRDYVDLVPDGNGGSRALTNEDYKTLTVTPEQARKMDEEGWQGTTIEFVDAKPQDD